jgi:hypothetical protein
MSPSGLMTSTPKTSNATLAALVTVTLLTSAAVTASGNLQLIFAQQPPAQPAQPLSPQPQSQQQQKAPLNFYLKPANNASAAQAASQATANGTGTKNMTVTVNVQQGPGGQQIPLPISAVVPANIQPQDMQLCASLATGSESCQPLSEQQASSIDLTQVGAAAGATPAPMGTASPMPAPAPTPPAAVPMSPVPAPQPVPQSYPNFGGANDAVNLVIETLTSAFTVQNANAQLISIEDTTVNIPITVIVPIDLNIQNAQVCASVLSEGSQSCTQVVLNPTQTSYTDVNVDLSSPTPSLTTAQQEPTTALSTTTAQPTTTATQPLTTAEPTPTSPTTTAEPAAPSTTEEPTADTGTQEGQTTTQEPPTEGSTSEGSGQ